MEPVEEKLQEIRFGHITKINIARAFSHKGQMASPGHVWYKVSYHVDGSGRYKGAVQISRLWEKKHGQAAAEQYIKDTYIFKTEK